MTKGFYNRGMDDPQRIEYFEKIYRETFKRLSQYVFFKAPTVHDAEDIVAAVYSDFYQYIVLQNKRPLAVTAYLIRMANHELSRFYRDRDRLPSLSIEDESLGLSNTLPDNEDALMTVLDQFEQEDLWKAVMQLSLPEQQVLLAKIRFDLNFRQIAAKYNQGESAVKLRYYRALKKLADRLQ